MALYLYYRSLRPPPCLCSMIFFINFIYNAICLLVFFHCGIIEYHADCYYQVNFEYIFFLNNKVNIRIYNNNNNK